MNIDPWRNACKAGNAIDRPFFARSCWANADKGGGGGSHVKMNVLSARDPMPSESRLDENVPIAFGSVADHFDVAAALQFSRRNSSAQIARTAGVFSKTFAEYRSARRSAHPL